MREPLLICLVIGGLFMAACSTDPGTSNSETNNDDNVVVISDCDGPSDCPIGKTCMNQMCVSATEQCVSDEDCGADRRCDDGVCFAKEREVRPVPDGGIPDPPEDDMGTGGCAGCIDPVTGACLDGNTEAACGGGGADCSTCEGDAVCDEGACVMPQTCDTTNCDGCCNADGECVAGDADTACGTGGDACQQCSAPAVCGDGACVVPCNEDTCDGCCDADGECIAGDADAACGSGGVACAACGTDQTCSTGECVDLGCSETCNGCCDGDQCLSGNLESACGWFGDACVSCGTGMECSVGQCVVDPDSKWDIQVVSATVPDRDANGDTWDSFGGLPDPFVRLETEDGVNTFSAETDDVPNTTTPFYFDTILTGVPARALQDRLTVWVRDADTFGSTTMGSCYSEFVQSDFSGAAFDINCPANNDQVAVTVRLRVTPN